MRVQSFCLFFFLLVTPSLGEDTVAEDIGVHQMERLVEMLTSKECQDLLFALSHPEENIFMRLKRLSPEHDPLGLQPGAQRDAAPAAESEAPCRAALTAWMQRHGQQTYFDRLSRALQHIGRTDIAIEVGKNINQDKVLNLKRYVEDYHKYVESLNYPPKQSDSKDQRQNREVKTRRVRDLTARDLDLIVERAPVSLYLKGPMDVALPFLSGVLLGFGATLLAGVSVLLVVVHIANRSRKNGDPRVASSRLRFKNAGPGKP